jgi:hypothetical protein
MVFGAFLVFVGVAADFANFGLFGSAIVFAVCFSFRIPS